MLKKRTARSTCAAYLGQRSIHKRLDTFIALHVMTQVDLYKLVLRDRRCDCINDISERLHASLGDVATQLVDVDTDCRWH